MKYRENYTDNFKKIFKSLFILLKKAQAVVQKTSRNNVTSTVLIFSSFLSFWWTSWVEKSQSTKKNCTKIEKEETHTHRKRARSALSRERTLELRQWYTTQVGSARFDSTGVVKVNRRKTNCRKTRPYCTFLQNARKCLSYTRLHFLLRIKNIHGHLLLAIVRPSGKCYLKLVTSYSLYIHVHRWSWTWHKWL
jgi:hypothetical protein